MATVAETSERVRLELEGMTCASCPARIERQVRGIERMLEDERYCTDILTQIGAVNTALESLALEILDDHVNHCVTGALASGDAKEAEQKGQELLEPVHRFARTR